jgi:crotonobetainyl-CoA:carnitine CoA-transferase CaiB-like acyl-CoA transferase
VKLSTSPGRIARRPPLLGEHTDDVLAECGLATAEIDELRNAGLI